MARLTTRYALILLDSLQTVVSTCLGLGLECRDSPLASTPLLFSMGYGQYEVRSLWSRIPRGEFSGGTLYRYGSAVFNLIVSHTLESLFVARVNGLAFPVDAYDAEMLRRRRVAVRRSPHTHALRLYIFGRISEHVEVSVNVVRLLLLLGRARGKGVVERLLDSLRLLLSRGDVGGLEESLLDNVLNPYIGVLGVILPRTPQSIEELEALSPVLRRLRASRGLP